MTDMDPWLILGLMIYIPAGAAFFILIVAPLAAKRSEERIKRLFTSDDPKDVEFMNHIGATLTNHVIMGTQNLMVAAINGDPNARGVVQNFAGGIMDAIHMKMEGAKNGAMGNAKREILKDNNPLAHYEQIREDIPARYRKFTDTGAALATFMQMYMSRKGDGGTGSSGGPDVQYVKVG
ncbi:MAG: hypothetical protein ACYTEQ_24820 [Planctomycetota bacterium]